MGHIFPQSAQKGFLLFPSYSFGEKHTKIIGHMPWLYMYMYNQFTFIGPLKLNEEYEKLLIKIEIF